MNFRALTLLAALSLSAGCFVTEDAGGDDPAPTPTPTPTATPGSIAASWQPVVADVSGLPVSGTCPDDGATVFLQPEGGTPAGHRFACDALSGSVAAAPGRYSVWVRLDDGAETRLAESQPQVVDVASGEPTAASFDVWVGYGFYTLSWDLTQSASSLTCAQVAGENGVAITAMDGGGALLDTTVDCEAGIAPSNTETRPLPLGEYTLTVAVLDSSDQVIAQSATIVPAVSGALDYGGERRDLGVIEIPIP